MTPEEYLQTLSDTIYTNNRIIRDNQVLQTRLLTMLENAYLASNPNINHTNFTNNILNNPINMRYTTNTRNTTNNIRNNRNNSRLIQDYVFSYIFEPYTTTTSSTIERQLPTVEQITNSTNTVIYDSSNTEFTTHVCPITLTDFTNGENLLRIRHCHHIFKEASLLNWFSRNALCPLCRYDIRDYVNEESEEVSRESAADDDEVPSLDTINYNIYNNENESTQSRTSRFTPVIRNFTSQMNIPETLTNEISDIFSQFINNNYNTR